MCEGLIPRSARHGWVALVVVFVASFGTVRQADGATVTINDALPNETIGLAWTGLSGTVSLSCSGGFTDSSNIGLPNGSAACNEQQANLTPALITLDFQLTVSGSANQIGVNIWEDFVGGTLSDTLVIRELSSSLPRPFRIEFRSDVDGGVALTPLTALGNNLTDLFDRLEADGPLIFTDEEFGHTLTVLLDTEPTAVPEPASLTLLGIGMTGVARQWLKRRRTS
jgi:PEP-CTERM motif-containing protein